MFVRARVYKNNIKYMETSFHFMYPLESADCNLWKLRCIPFEINLPMWYTLRGLFLVEKLHRQ
jgi:hypothetical protein